MALRGYTCGMAGAALIGIKCGARAVADPTTMELPEACPDDMVDRMEAVYAERRELSEKHERICCPSAIRLSENQADSTNSAVHTAERIQIADVFTCV